MAYSVNHIVLVGNITKNPELQYTKGGYPVLNLGLATNRSIKRKNADGSEKWDSVPEFHMVVFFGKAAEIIAEQCFKGDKIYIDGRMTYEKWTDKSDVSHTVAKVLGQNFMLFNKHDKANVEEFSEEKIKADLAAAGKTKKKEVEPKKDEMDEDVDPSEIPDTTSADGEVTEDDQPF